MRRLAFTVALLTALAVASLEMRGDSAPAAPALSEVLGLLRQHLSGFSPEQLDRAAVEGLIGALHPRVMLVTNAAAPVLPAQLDQARVFEDNVGYLRVATVGAGLKALLVEAHRELTRTGHIVGMVFDLRYAGGEDYEVIGEVAGLLVKAPAPLLDVDGQVIRVQTADAPWELPVAVLVNRQTAGAAEALATALRFKGVALILGNETAGAAARWRDYPLANGQFLRIAGAPVKLANGTPLSPQRLQPDIAVTVDAADERLFFDDPYRESPTPAEMAAGTNRVTRRPRPNEADLVRARREGLPLDAEGIVTRETGPARPVLRDPVLARAVDLLKSLAIIRDAPHAPASSPGFRR